MTNLDPAAGPASDDLTIKAAVHRAMAAWKAGGTLNIDTMREQIDWLVEEAVVEFQTDNVDCVTNEELEGPDA